MLRSKKPSDTGLALPRGSQELLLGGISISSLVDKLTLEDNASIVC